MAKAYEVKWTRNSSNELDVILEYLAGKSIQGYESFRLSMCETLERLCANPLFGAVYEETQIDQIREVMVESYRLFYRVLEQSSRIQVMHLRHVARQDPIESDFNR